jgi:hypothetical protein
MRSLNLSAIGEMDKTTRFKYIGVVDKLRELGINEDLSLPQICRTILPRLLNY